MIALPASLPLPASVVDALCQSARLEHLRFSLRLRDTSSRIKISNAAHNLVGSGRGRVRHAIVDRGEQAVDFASEPLVTEVQMQETLRLVECAMLASTAGLAYFLSNLFRFESYFGCFFPLPVVISAMRWGAVAGRKTMVTTALLLLVIAGPLKALSYVLMHGLLGVAMGALWRWRFNWFVSILACTLVRAVGAVGFVYLSSWLIKENIFNLITINTHASLSYMVAAMGINVSLTMPAIYAVFMSLLVVNCASFVFLLHVLYAIILQGLGIKSSMAVPGWVSRST